MKKTVILMLLLCFLLAGTLGFVFGKSSLNRAVATAEPAASETPVEETAEAEETAEVEETAEAEETAEVEETAEAEEGAGRLDFAAIYALHESGEVVMTVGERDITWGEYFYYLYRQAKSVESYLDTMAMYGLEVAWKDAISEDAPDTYADYAIMSAEQTALSLTAMEGYARSVGTALSEENIAAIEEKEASDYVAACGEGATREDFEAFLETIYLPGEVYDYMNEASVLYQQAYLDCYGESGGKLSDEEAVAWLELNEYMAANHILFLTIDMSTGEALDDEVKAEKLAQAQTLSEELRAMEDKEALLARFLELKQELDEDTGKTAYPNGYIFAPGQMVSEFENAVKAQAAYEVSEPVESSYGYHIILTMPLDPDAVIEYSSSGAPMTGRTLAANDAYAEAVDAYAQTLTAAWKEGYEAPDLLAFVK